MKIFNKNKYIPYIIICVFLIATVFGFIIDYTIGILLCIPSSIFIAIKVIDILNDKKLEKRVNNNVSSNQSSTSEDASTILASNENNNLEQTVYDNQTIQETTQPNWVYDQNTGYYYDSVSGYYYDPNTGQYYDPRLNTETQTTQETAQPNWVYDQNTGYYYDSVSGYYYDPNTGQYYDPRLNNQAQTSENDNILNDLIEKGKEVRKIKVQNASSNINFDTSSQYLDHIKNNNIENDELLDKEIAKLEENNSEELKGFKNDIDRGPEVQIEDEFDASNNVSEEIVVEDENPIPQEDIVVINDDGTTGDDAEEVETGSKTKIIGKVEKNIVKKGMILKKEELIALICVLLEKDSLPSNYRNTIKKFLNEYIDKKYLKQTEMSLLRTKAGVIKIMDNYINSYATKLIKIATNNPSKNKVARIRYLFMILNKIDCENPDIDNIVKDANVFKNPEEVAKRIRETKRKYKASYRKYFSRISTQKFKLEFEEISNPHETIYNTSIVSTIKFSKLFSDYVIDKSFNTEIISEDMKLVQLKMLSSRVLKDLLDLYYDQRYIISFPETLFSKSKKMVAYLTCINDYYSQSKILILVNDSIVKNCFKVLFQLKKLGYSFVLQSSTDSLNNDDELKNYLYLFDFIFVLDDNKVEDKINYDRIPNNLWKYIINIDESLMKEVIIE